MEQHIRILSVLFIILGILGLIGAVVVFMMGAGAVATILAEGDADAEIGAAWAGGCMTFVAVMIGLLSIPSFIAGWGLAQRKPWSRILTIVLGILSLLNFPLGTAIGVYALVIMFNDETKMILDA